jgi:hypothetical protein
MEENRFNIGTFFNNELLNSECVSLAWLNAGKCLPMLYVGGEGKKFKALATVNANDLLSTRKLFKEHGLMIAEQLLFEELKRRIALNYTEKDRENYFSLLRAYAKFPETTTLKIRCYLYNPN